MLPRVVDAPSAAGPLCALPELTRGGAGKRAGLACIVPWKRVGGCECHGGRNTRAQAAGSAGTGGRRSRQVTRATRPFI